MLGRKGWRYSLLVSGMEKAGMQILGFPRAGKYCSPYLLSCNFIPYVINKTTTPRRQRRGLIPLPGQSLPIGPVGVVVSKTR